ncbi:uncharacterized protein LOC135810893 [Sycon ciliatum]|uniref:uncharacterized protein LOC135810893 n=1 Tax=Sycon ciliatum TaxID=27933 RepID=UPI0031F5F256
MASTKDHAHFFCDNLARGDNASSSVLHNSNADTNHNELCQGRSAWEVLRQYQDFSNSHTKKPNTSLTPVFRYAVKCTGELNVFIVDVANRTTRPKNANRKQPINKFLGLVWRRIEGLFSTSTSNYANAAIITYDSSGKSQDVITKSPKVLLANVRGKTQLGKDMLQLRHGVNSVNAASLDKALDLALDLMQHVVWVTKQTHESSTRRAIVISKNLVSLSSSLCKPVPEDVPGAQLLFFSTSVPRNAIHPCNTSVPRRFCRHIHHLAHFTNYTAQCTRTVFGASAYIPQSRGTRTIAGNINMNAKTGRPAAGRMDYNIHVTVKINPPARFTLRFQFQHFDPNEVGRKINRTMNATLDHDEQIWHKGFEMSSSLDAVGFKLDITAHSRPGTYYLVVNGTPKLGLATMPPTPRRADDEWFRPLSSSKMGSTRSACNCL